MAQNTKTTSHNVASIASGILQDPNASQIQKSLAGSALAQSGSSKQTGKEMETKASNVMNSKKYSKETKELAASILAQANKAR